MAGDASAVTYALPSGQCSRLKAWALLDVRARVHAGCSRTVYLLDDGKDPKKRKWCDKLGDDVVYVSGRKRPANESNGKSGNLNNALSQIYPEGCKIPINEVICVMDADQVLLLS